MKFILLFGPPAVGKMTVGREIEKKTGIKLFHNHETIEMVVKYFDFGTPQFNRLVRSFRQQMFEEAAKSDLPGLTFTFVWDLDGEDDHRFVRETCAIFEKEGADIYFAELYTDLDERLKRNKTPERLAAKPTKRNLESSEANLLYVEKYRVNTQDNALDYPYPHVCVDNTNLSAEEAATEIINGLGLD